MTSTELAKSIFERRKTNEWASRMTVKQVNFFLSLLQKERNSPPVVQRVYPIYGTVPPLEVVVYPNGAGFVRVSQWAITPDHVTSKWRLKTDLELQADRGL